jgi:hypothetical protein
VLDGGWVGRGLRTSQAGFDERRSWRRQLRPAGKEKTQWMLRKPTLGVLQGEKRVILLAPVRRSCCLELFCDQCGDPF